MNQLINNCINNIPYVITSTDQLIQSIMKIPRNKIKEHPHLISLDVKDMYTSIPAKDAINCVFDHLTSANFNYHGITAVDVKDLCSTITSNSYFEYDGKIFLQFKGLPMGNIISGTLANIFMGTIENTILNSLDCPGYFRYVDDTLIFCRNSIEASNILHAFNSANNNLQFEMEEANNRRLNILDLTLETDNDGNINWNLFRKPIRSDIFIQRHTALPTKQINNIVRNEVNRIALRCQTPKNRSYQLSLFQERLLNNGFSREEVRKLVPLNYQTRMLRRTNQNQDKKYFLRIPYINDHVDAQVKNTFKKMGINVFIAHRGQKLCDKLVKPRKYVCKVPNCIVPKHLCFKKRVVYRLTCNSCSSVYIGCTKRFLHTRVNEHLKQKKSAIKSHTQVCRQSTWKIDVITYGTDLIDLQMKEAYFINLLRPQLNTKEELAPFMIIT